MNKLSMSGMIMMMIPEQTNTDRFGFTKRMLFVRNYRSCELTLPVFTAFVGLGIVFTLTLLFVMLSGMMSTHAEAQSQPLTIQPPASYPVPSSFLPPSISDLDLVLYSDGLVHVSYILELDPLAPYVTVDLYGSAVDNFVAVGENGYILSEDISDTAAMIHTFGTATAVIDYDIHDLVSKSGRMWKFEIDTPIDFSLHMPPDTILVGIDVIPDNLTIHEDHALTLYLDSGRTDLIYITTSSITHPHKIYANTSNGSVLQENSLLPAQNVSTPADLQNNVVEGLDVSTIIITITIAAATAVFVIILFFKNRAKNTTINHEKNKLVSTYDAHDTPTDEDSDVSLQHEKQPQQQQQQPQPQPPSTSLSSHDLEEMLLLHDYLRDDDKDIVRFISESGGVVLESDLRKKFMEPKTTMWRAVKRLERSGIVTTTKKDMQNQVRLVSHVKQKETEKEKNKTAQQDKKGDKL